MTDFRQDAEKEARPERHHDFEADAVCAQCGLVNEEGTLYCHQCGNNLRDQRRIRLEAETLLMHQDDALQRRQWIRRAMGAVGLVLVLIAGLRANHIAEWLLEVQEPNPDDPRLLWVAPQTAHFDGLLAELQTTIPDQESLAELSFVAANDFPDRGVLALYQDEEAVGLVQVARYSDLVLFAARLFSGEEIRGRARIQGQWLVLDFTEGGVRQGRRYAAAAGAAQREVDGSFLCYGQREGSDATYIFKAYLIASE